MAVVKVRSLFYDHCDLPAFFASSLCFLAISLASAVVILFVVLFCGIFTPFAL
jgi:hypothetical protein